MPAEQPLARLLVALLLLTQATLPAAAALAEEPPAPAAHHPHVSEEPGTGCQPLHDELECLLCRIFSSQSLAASLQVAPKPDARELRLGAPGVASLPPADGHPSLHFARAPPSC